MRPDHSSSDSSTQKALWSWTLYDCATQSYATIIHTFVFAAYYTRQVASNPEQGTTHWSLAIGLSGLAVALLGPIFGAFADKAGRRKPWLVSFSLFCAIATAGLWFIHPNPDQSLPALALLATASFTIHSAAIFYNAMLPDLATRDVYGRWSGRGWAMGYAGGLCCLGAVYLLFLGDHPLIPLNRDMARHVRAAFPFVSIWLLLFTLPLVLFTPDRPSSGLTRCQAVRQGLKQLRDTFQNIRQFRHVVRFLIARAIYSDGLATLFAMGGVYAAGTFDMSESGVLLFGVGLNITAGLGAAGFSTIDDSIGSRTTILISLSALSICTSIILLVQTPFWFWCFGLLLGVFVGPIQASSRSYLSQLAPEEMRAQLFGVYAFAGKATSFLGPLIVAGLTALFQSQRLGLIIIPVYFAAGLLISRGLPKM